MENPMSWDEPTKVIAQALQEAAEATAKGICGPSVAKRISLALRAKGLLKDD